MTRSRRFEQRINIERLALEIINTSEIGREEQLAGLTAAAIQSWSSRLNEHYNERQVASLREILVAIATETGLLSDNSRAVFSSSAAHNDRTIDSLLSALAAQCGNQFASSLR
ncbi:hypothetical protein [Rhizobium sp. YS-1r]|uniref:hypothetical protein n=1 Tax=Rhizobium sp. YS-1r TaxID=1532558 RepID=UPI00126A4BB7|nr:hypothetical protein [Rhizobium sp. YS-1r]